jgi:Zn-dependent protease with chaperone function
MKKTLNITLILLISLSLAGCAATSSTKSGAVGIDRKQHMELVSEADAVNQSALAYQQTIKDAQTKKLLNTDSKETQRVRGIAQKLIAQVGVFRPDAVNWKWEINVQDSKEINAYCMAGGKIMVYTGLLDQIKPTDDELAAVMGHEISHALREHVREQMSRAKAQQLGILGLAAIIGVTTDSSKNAAATLAIGAPIAAVALTLPNSRTAEHEADEMGLELAARAGYNPNAAVSLWEKMGKASNGNKPCRCFTHRRHQALDPSSDAAVPTSQQVNPLSKKRCRLERQFQVK